MPNEIPKEVIDFMKTVDDSDVILQQLEELHSKKQKSVKDWYNEFAKAEIRGFFPKHCERSAKNWGCCAIGARLQIEAPELAKEFASRPNSGSFYRNYQVLTKEANQLGLDFYDAICNDDVKEAKRLFNKIHSLPRIFKTDEEVKYDRLPLFKKLFSKQPKLEKVE